MSNKKWKTGEFFLAIAVHLNFKHVPDPAEVPFSMEDIGMKIGVIRRLPSDVRASICLSVGP